MNTQCPTIRVDTCNTKEKPARGGRGSLNKDICASRRSIDPMDIYASKIDADKDMLL
jgi:hypothetical protein